MIKYKISQTKSSIGRPEIQKRTLLALGLKKLHNPVIKEGTPQILGMINKVKHLLSIEEVQA
jgi:large subunit ribosomal protein L30